MTAVEKYREHRAVAACDTELGLAILVNKADAAIAELEEDREKLSDDLFTALTRAERAEAALEERPCPCDCCGWCARSSLIIDAKYEDDRAYYCMDDDGTRIHPTDHCKFSPSHFARHDAETDK